VQKILDIDDDLSRTKAVHLFLQWFSSLELSSIDSLDFQNLPLDPQVQQLKPWLEKNFINLSPELFTNFCRFMVPSFCIYCFTELITDFLQLGRKKLSLSFLMRIRKTASKCFRTMSKEHLTRTIVFLCFSNRLDMVRQLDKVHILMDFY
jgi:hypothetical protein